MALGHGAQRIHGPLRPSLPADARPWHWRWSLKVLRGTRRPRLRRSPVCRPPGEHRPRRHPGTGTCATGCTRRRSARPQLLTMLVDVVDQALGWPVELGRGEPTRSRVSRSPGTTGGSPVPARPAAPAHRWSSPTTCRRRCAPAAPSESGTIPNCSPARLHAALTLSFSGPCTSSTAKRIARSRSRRVLPRCRHDFHPPGVGSLLQSRGGRSSTRPTPTHRQLRPPDPTCQRPVQQSPAPQRPVATMVHSSGHDRRRTTTGGFGAPGTPWLLTPAVGYSSPPTARATCRPQPRGCRRGAPHLLGKGCAASVPGRCGDAQLPTAGRSPGCARAA